MPLLIKSESVKMQPTKSYPHVVQLGLVFSMEDAKMGCLWTCRWPFRFIFEPMVRRGFTVIQAEDDLSPLNKLGLLH
jgi:hypothetical protein